MRRVVVTGLGSRHPAGHGRRDGVGKHPRRQIRCGHRSPASMPPTGYACTIACEVKPAGSSLRLRSGQARRSQGPAAGRSLHHLRYRCRGSGARGCRPDRDERRGELARRRVDRIGDRRLAGYRDRIDRAAREGADSSRLAALRSRPPHQSDLGPGLDQIWPARTQSCGRHRLLDRSACDRRCRTDDCDGRCRRDARRRRGKHRLPAGHRRLQHRRARFPPASTITPEKASRPYDKDRDGFVMGEGAGVAVSRGI